MTTDNLQQATITATGEAKVPIACDVAWLHLVLVEEATIVSEAIERSSERISLVLDRIRETEPQLPETVTEIERKVTPTFAADGSVEGFRVHRVVRAQMSPEPAGLLLDVAIMSGAGPGSRIAFGVRDPAAARARAIDAALAAAQANAAAAARSLGCELGELRATSVESVVPHDFADPLLVVAAQARLVYARPS